MVMNYKKQLINLMLMNVKKTKNNLSLKRHVTSELPRYLENNSNELNDVIDDGGNWTIVPENKQKKKLNDKDDRFSLNLNRTFTNAIHHREKQFTTNTNNIRWQHR